METWKEREWRMSCPKISALLSQHWRHSAHCDCLGSCWRANSLNEDCQHARKRFWHCLVLLSTKSTQASALSHDSDLSKKRSGKKKGLQLQCYVSLFIVVRRWGQCWRTKPDLCPLLLSRRDAYLIECIKFCVVLSWKDAYTRGDVTRCQTIMIMKPWRKLSALGKRWDTALRGLSKLSPPPTSTAMITVSLVYWQGRAWGFHGFHWPRVG